MHQVAEVAGEVLGGFGGQSEGLEFEEGEGTTASRELHGLFVFDDSHEEFLVFAEMPGDQLGGLRKEAFLLVFPDGGVGLNAEIRHDCGSRFNFDLPR